PRPPLSPLFPYTTLFRSGDVAGDHQADRRDMQTGRVIGVGVSAFQVNQVVPFEIDHISLELLGDHPSVRVWPGKQTLQKFPTNSDRKSTRLNSSHVAISY